MAIGQRYVTTVVNFYKGDITMRIFNFMLIFTICGISELRAQVSRPEMVGFHDEGLPFVIDFAGIDGLHHASYDGGVTWPGESRTGLSYFAAAKPHSSIVFRNLSGKEYVSFDGGASFWNPKGTPWRLHSEPTPHKADPPTSKPISAPEVAVTAITPNPSNDITQIHFFVPEAGHIKLIIESTIRTAEVVIADADFSPGEHFAQFDASTLPDGLYNYRLETAGLITTGGFIVLHK